MSSPDHTEPNGLQDKGAALGTVFLMLGAIGFGYMYQWGPKIILVNCFAAGLAAWRLLLAYKR